ncbi:MAG: hypothetical protein ACLRFE_03895 [Clostridia bacterium]
MISIIISAVIAVFAIVILYLTRGNIIELLDRDVVMYDKNYQIKCDNMKEAFDCLDVVALNGLDVKNNPQFVARAKEAYNGLLCCVNNPKIYQEFYRLTLDTSIGGFSVEDIEKFKIECRNELISKRKGRGEGFKGVGRGSLNGYGGISGLSTTQVSQPVKPAPVKRPPAKPVQRPQPQQPKLPIEDDEN